MTESWTWVDGKLTAINEAVVAADDPAVTAGLAVFETCALVDGQPRLLRRHLNRLREATTRIGAPLSMTDGELRSRLAELVAASGASSGSGLWRLRITVSASASVMMSIDEAPAHPPVARVVVLPWAVNDQSPVAGLKLTARPDLAVAREEALALGATEAVLTNTRGVLCEGTTSNVFLVLGGRLVTPSLSTGCLPGITRSLVIEGTEVSERDDILVDDLENSPEAFLTSSLRGVQPIASVGGQPLRAAPGPLTTKAAAAVSRALGASSP